MMLQCTGRTRIPTLGGGPNIPNPTAIPTRSKLPLLSSANPTTIVPSSAPASTVNVQQHRTGTVLPCNNVVVPISISPGCTQLLVGPPTDADLGCLVRVDDDRVGVLRYVGAVRFATGLWCGLELDGEQYMGKNDGQVNGVRYFKCPKQRGLMVPLSKVTLIQHEDSEDSMVSSSGPHSLLITNMGDETKTLNQTAQDTTRTLAHVRDNTFKKSTETLNENQTYTADNLDKSLNLGNVTYCNEDENNETLSNNQINLSKLDEFNETTDSLETPPCYNQSRQFLSLTCHSTPITLRTLNNIPQSQPTPATGSNTTTTSSHFLPAGSSIDDPTNKRNSLEFEESLGILTPDQMDATIGSGLMAFGCRSPSTSENMIWQSGSGLIIAGLTQDNTRNSCADLPNNTTTSTSTDLSPSLGIIDENGLAAAFNLKSFTASGDPLSLSLDVQQLLHNSQQRIHNLSNSACHQLLRSDQTPSPEELPLDPTPIMLCTGVGPDDGEEDGDVLMMVSPDGKAAGVGVGAERGKGTAGSFVASIISITSLDTGYQGDGEMSRPGSRGADNSSSPMTRRPQPRRNMCDPMTDSDFYTESDADCHESDPQNQQSNHHHHTHRNSGDRRAQVIDGTLYAADVHSSSSGTSQGGATSAAAVIYPDSGREPMDSSGVFTDIEGVTDAFSLNLNRTIVAASPSDSSTQTITDDSQQIRGVNNRGVVSGTSALVKSSSVKTLICGADRSGSERSSVSPKAGRLISSAKKEDAKYTKVGCSSAKKRAVESKVFKDATNTNTRLNASNPPSPQSTIQQQQHVQQQQSAAVQKKQGKWDAVLNKIGKGSRSAEARSLKEVKSRVYSSMTPTSQQQVASVKRASPSAGDKLTRARATGVGSKSVCASDGATKGENRDSNTKAASTKPRRILRTRATPSAAAAAKHSNIESSINSSLSDLSGASPAKKHGSLKPQRIGSAKLSPASLTGNSTTSGSGGNVTTPPQHSPKTPTTTANSTINNNNSINQQQHPHQGNNNNVINNNINKNASGAIATQSPVMCRGKREHHQTGLINSRSNATLLANAAEKERKITALPAAEITLKDNLSSRQSKHHNQNHNSIQQLPSSVSHNQAASTQPQHHHLNGNSNNANGTTTTTTTITNHCISPPQTRRVAVAARNLSTTTTAKTTISPQQSKNGDQTAKDAVRAAEALAVLVQHLVFDVDAFQAPILKQQVTVMRCDVDTARSTCNQLRETLREQTAKFTAALDKERSKSKAELMLLKKSHADDLEKVTKQRDDLEYVAKTLKSEMQKLQKIHEERLEILREENDSIRDQLDERNVEILSLQQQQKQQQPQITTSIECVDKTTDTELMLTEIGSENGYINENSQFDSNNQEVQSLRAVLDLKQSENGELRKALAEAVRKCDRLPSVEEKLSTRTARCEDLDLQLKLQREKEQELVAEMKKLKDSFKDAANQKRRLSQYNEELQWKLKQSKEVITKVMEQTGGEEQQQHLSRSTGLNSSFSEKNYHNTYAGSTSCIGALSCSPRHASSSGLDRSNSFRGRSNSNLSENSVINMCSSSPTSPKVKGVVTKSDSVSYVLDMDESADVLASRIVRRSFRTNSSNSPLRVSGGNDSSQQGGRSTSSFSPSPKQRSPSSNGSGRRASSSSGVTNVDGKNYLRSKSMTVRRTSESACSDSATNNTAVTEDEEDDDDDDMGVFWQFNPAANNSDSGQKRRLLPSSQSSTPCSRHEQTLLRSTSLEPKHVSHGQQETDDSDDEQIQLPALPRQGTVLPPPRHLATDACNSEDDDNSCSSSTSSADRL